MGLKDIFWKDTGPKDSSPKGNLSGQQVATKYYAPPAPGGITQSYAPEPIKGSIDITSAGEFEKYFLDIMDKANLPGPDYYEFARALEGLKNAGLPEEQKLLAVFAGFQAQGVTPQGLVDAANKYITILESKKTNEFEASVRDAQLVIGNRASRITELQKKNEELTKQIQSNATEADDLMKQNITSQSKLESKKTTFNMSFQNFIAKIQKDIQSIQTYLINGNTTK